MKKILFFILLFLGLWLVLSFAAFLYIMSGWFSTGIDLEDQKDAIDFCNKLFSAPEINDSTEDYLSFNDLPHSFKENAPCFGLFWLVSMTRHSFNNIKPKNCNSSY